MIYPYRELTDCRFCGGALAKALDLGVSPIANALAATQAEALASPTFPLELMECEARDCGLYQLSIAVDPPVLFPPSYTYATPDNPELTAHYRETLLWLLDLAPQWRLADLAVEIGSNNGAFLRALKNHTSIPRLVGVEPSEVAAPDVETVRAFFTEKLACKLRDTRARRAGAGLIIARHCLAHIDDVHDVMRGVTDLLSLHGVFYIENAYALPTLAEGQYDQLYHEHLSYFTVRALRNLLASHSMKILDVRLSPIHGGTLMVAAVREACPVPSTAAVGILELMERLQTSSPGFLKRVRGVIAYAEGLANLAKGEPFKGSTDAWGAAAKAVTRFSLMGLTHEHIRQCYDDSPLKQGKFLPGSGIPIVASPDTLDADAVFLTAWNYEKSFRKRYADYTGKIIV